MASLAGGGPEDRKSEQEPSCQGETSAKGISATVELLIWLGLLVLAAGALVWVHASCFFLQWSDEQVHLYVARRISEGAVLYRDIDSARPPLVLFPVALFIKLGLSPLLAGRACVVGCQLATAGILFWGGWRLASLRAGAIAALLFLVSPEVHSRIPYVGIQLVTLGLTACVLLSLRPRPLLAGLACGFTLGAGQHGIVICGVAGIWMTVRRWRDGVWFALGTLLAGGVVFGGTWALGGRNLWQSVVSRHLYHLKSAATDDADIGAYFPPWLLEQMPLLLCALAAMALWVAKRGQVKVGKTSPASPRPQGLLLVAIVAHVAVTLSMSGGLFLYLVVVTPFVALLGGLGVHELSDGFKRQRAMSDPRARRAVRNLLALGSVAVAISIGAWAAARALQARQTPGRDLHYSFWPYVRFGEMARIQKLDVANQVASELGTLPQNSSIFGHPIIASAVALAGGWRVAGELADLAPRWIEHGTIRREEIVSRIERDRVKAVVTPAWNLVKDPYFKAYLATCYDKPTTIRRPLGRPGQGIPSMLIFRHLENAYPCQVTPTSPRLVDSSRELYKRHLGL